MERLSRRGHLSLLRLEPAPVIGPHPPQRLCRLNTGAAADFLAVSHQDESRNDANLIFVSHAGTVAGVNCADLITLATKFGDRRTHPFDGRSSRRREEQELASLTGRVLTVGRRQTVPVLHQYEDDGEKNEGGETCQMKLRHGTWTSSLAFFGNSTKVRGSPATD